MLSKANSAFESVLLFLLFVLSASFVVWLIVILWRAIFHA